MDWQVAERQNGWSPPRQLMFEPAPATDESERNENNVSLTSVLDGCVMDAVRQPWARDGLRTECWIE